VRPDEVLLMEVKPAEDGNGLILRLFNPGGVNHTAVLDINESLLGRYTKAVEVDLLERPVEPNTAGLEKSKLTVMVPANAISTVKLLK